MKHFVLALLFVVAFGTQANAQKRVMNISTSSNTLNMEQILNTEQTARLNRFFFAGYNTLCLPMSLTAEQVANAAEGLQIERLAAIRQEGSALVLYFLDCTDEGIQAGVPYMVFSPKHQTFRAINTDALGFSTNLSTIRMNDDKGNQVAFCGTWKGLREEGRYGIPAQQDAYPLQSILVRTNADKTFLPTRCGIVWEEQSGSATELAVKHVTDLNEVTAISNLKVKGSRVDVYDMKGNMIRKQANGQNALIGLPSGIYVINGEKVAVK
ncbi:MAG: T9SS type A sorting domain-containing protein [Prevotella sp.]|nr:T9SS type A sorting domain-containing protein [Prevotella sp.]